jgi:2'-hydroxyisoflavone reductase
MRILFIGGTRFVGRAMAAAAIAAGHQVTLLHRGGGDDRLFPEATHLHADRNGDLAVLATGDWDATVDVSAYLPRQVESLATALAGRGGHHVYISTVSVYRDPDGPGADEGAPVWDPAPDDVHEVTGETYGPLKVACELAARNRYGDRLAIVRPTYVVGPHDPTGRFTWWVARASRGRPMLAPGPADVPMQLVDARDMGAWVVSLAERQQAGTFTAAQPASTFGDMLAGTAAAAGGGAELVWVDADWLLEQGIGGGEQPLWSEGRSDWALAMSTDRASDAGLTHRSLAETVRDTQAWIREMGEDNVPGTGNWLSAERESDLLTAWSAR